MTFRNKGSEFPRSVEYWDRIIRSVVYAEALWVPGMGYLHTLEPADQDAEALVLLAELSGFQT